MKRMKMSVPQLQVQMQKSPEDPPQYSRRVEEYRDCGIARLYFLGMLSDSW